MPLRHYFINGISKMKLNSEISSVKFKQAVGELELDKRGIPFLTIENIKKVHDYVVNYSSYSTQSGDDFARKYFLEHKGDTSKSSIIVKIILIDTIDSTNLKRQLGKDYYKLLADRIIKENIEEKIEKGEKIGKSFKKIAKWSAKEINRQTDFNLFVFVSKYITRTNQLSYGRDDYFILDTVIKEKIHCVKDKTGKTLFNPGELEKLRQAYGYDKYCSEMSKRIAKLPGITKEMLDHFIWFTFKTEAANDK